MKGLAVTFIASETTGLVANLMEDTATPGSAPESILAPELTFGHEETAAATPALIPQAPRVIRGKLDRFGVAMGTGRRKTAVARVRIKSGSRNAFLDETGFTARDVHRFLSGFAAASRPVEIHFRWRPQLTDPNDEFVLEAAVNAGSVPLVTHNTRDFVIATQRFNLLVFTPGQFLRKLAP